MLEVKSVDRKLEKKMGVAHGPKPNRKNFVQVHVRSLQVKMDLHLPAIPQFNPNGDPSSLGQRWNKWKKSFEYYLQQLSQIKQDRGLHCCTLLDPRLKRFLRLSDW